MRQANVWSGLFITCGFLAACAGLSACNMATPSDVQTSQIRIMDKMKTVQVDAGAVHAEAVAEIADDYRATGKSRAMLLLPYLQGNPVNKVAARHRGDMYKRAFAARGVKAVDVSYQPVATADEAKIGVLSYMALAAVAPDDCTPMTGYNGADTLADDGKYKIGCEMKTAVSRMIVQPSDLLGTAGTPQNESRREGAVVEKFKAGKPNPPLQNTYNASAVGTGSGG